MEMMSPYSRRLTRQHPGMIVLLLDQSASMSEPVAGTSGTKAQFARAAVNEVIFNLISRAGTDDSTGTCKRLAYISVLGYNDNVYPLLGPTSAPVPIDFLADNPPGMERVQVDVLDTNSGTFRNTTVSRPIWVTTSVANGQTHMGKALDEARVAIERWIDSPPEGRQSPRPESFPPVIINITDAEDNGGNDPVQAATAIHGIGTLQGASLVFTGHIGKVNDSPTVFPSYESQVSSLHPMATTMFRMSSLIPDSLLAKATDVAGGQTVSSGARAFVYNANSELLVAFLKLGTMGTAGME